MKTIVHSWKVLHTPEGMTVIINGEAFEFGACRSAFVFDVNRAASGYNAVESQEEQFTEYRLPGGRIISVDSTAAKNAPTILHTLENGRIVTAIRADIKD